MHSQHERWHISFRLGIKSQLERRQLLPSSSGGKSRHLLHVKIAGRLWRGTIDSKAGGMKGLGNRVDYQL